jgi:radical SAM superfamily enzyme YgiQ (UPF0313 family)
MKLLLINPKFPESFWSFKWATDAIVPDKRTTNPPLGLATLAALCPSDWKIEIIDENIETIPLNPEADIIGICGMGVQFNRQKELLKFYRQKGFYIVAGGSYASLCPELYEDIADTVISGEAEYIWKEFCKDYIIGHPKRLYRETGEVDITDSPVPRFDLLDLKKYRSVSLQFSRGCPFRCEFCDIIVMFGRKPRTKSMEQVGRELDMLRKLNVKSTFYVDDNLIGNKKVAKELLRFLREYQTKHNYWFQFGTEASLNMAQDDELLQLFREANFKWVFIGIESPDEESLKETKKYQNTRHDMISSIRHIYSYGIEIYAGFIVGFDNDTTTIFDKQYNFITDSGIQIAMVGLLTALPKTPLYERLQEEGRLIYADNSTDNTKMGTNFIPKNMTYKEMVDGYRELYKRLVDYRNIAKRIKNKTRFLTKPVWNYSYSDKGQLGVIKNFIIQTLKKGKLRWLYHFLRTYPYFRPRLIPVVVQDWVFGMSMRDFVDRNFIHEFETTNQIAHKYSEIIKNTFNHYLDHGALEVSLNQVKDKATHLSIHLKGILEKDFFKRAEHHLEKLLRDSASSITLRIEVLHETHYKHLKRLLNKLSRYGDRINIVVNEKIRHSVEIDSSVFNFILLS